MALTIIERNVQLDVYDHDLTPSTIKAIALDSKTRYVGAEIHNGGQTYDVGQNTGVTLTVIRPDKTGVQVTGSTFQYTVGEGESVYGAYAELTQTALAISGTLKAQFMLTSGDQILRTEIFNINNGVALDAEVSEWAGEYQGYNLDELVQNVNESSAKVDAMEQDVSELKEGLSDLKEDLEHTNNGNGLLSLGNIILTQGGNNTTTKAVRTNDYISDDVVKIIAKENKFALILCAYDGNNNNAYVGHSYGNGTDLISTNSEGTHVFSIDMREWRAAYPNYKWRLSAHSNPWREITLEEAYQYFSFAYLNIVSRDKFDEYKANDVLANSLFISMSANNEWYFETDDNLNIYVKAYPYLLVRGGQTAPDSYTIQWSDIVTNLSQYIVTSPKGVINCLKLEGGQSLCLDIVGKTLAVKPISHQRYPYFADIIVNFNGRIIKGQIDAYIGWTNYKSITELQSKLADVAYVPDAMKTALTTINENATYNYPNMAKLLWISDVHWNNDCYAYLKYLADFGQYDALIISGDLNYYQFEQTLEATKTGMSELARLWNSYYRGRTIVLPIRGNHDGHVGYSDYTSEMFANAVIKPFHDCEDNGYYYYDLEKYRIRVVMLNSSDDAQSRKGFKSAEVAWFSNVINSVESGWSVISVSHHPIVEQLNTESSLAGNSSGIVSAINSFVANKQDCRYIAHLSGHAHRDMMDKISGVNYVSIIDSSTDQSDYSADILCINQSTHTVNLLRSGEGQNRSFTY